tara:strand:+ start:196 stop:459 length:264 start_codon:yes stop_codon:yes gene_type:complete
MNKHIFCYAICFYVIVLLFIISIENKGSNIGSKEQELAEYGYFQGQLDAMKGEYHIKKIKDHYDWADSPWDDGRKTILDITKENYDN